TNKAATEMRERVQELVGPGAPAWGAWPFPRASVRSLRRAPAGAGRRTPSRTSATPAPRGRTPRTPRASDPATTTHAPGALASRSSSLKNELTDPIDFADQAESSKNPFERTLARIYTNYTERLRQANAVDFDDLIGLTVTMLRENPAIREGYRRRF